MDAERKIGVWEMVEVPLRGARGYDNPYTDVEVWVDLEGPGFSRRCCGFWDGGDAWKVRVTAPAAGQWTWTSGCSADDEGLAGRTGGFEAVDWPPEALAANPNRRGFARATPDGHALQYADGTPLLLIGDTWWPAGSFRFPMPESDEPREMGPDARFPDFVRYRQSQGYNCIAMIATQPAWHSDGFPHLLYDDEGTLLRDAWQQGRSGTAKDMRDEEGNRSFEVPGKVPGFERVWPDVDRINPAFFRSLDRKVRWLCDRGFIPFMETARRDVGPAWRKYYDWTDSYVRLIQYVFSRYQAFPCILSPLHFDYGGRTIAAREWYDVIRRHHERYGPPPFGNLVTTNIDSSTLETWGHRDSAPWLTLHQVGNTPREHAICEKLTDIFRQDRPLPALNGEPYYAGWHPVKALEPGTESDDRNCRSAMYGSILSGGLAGHIYGALGLWGGDVEEDAAMRTWEGVRLASGAQMALLRDFVLSAGQKYQHLRPRPEWVDPARAGDPDGHAGWAYCAATEAADFLLLYFEAECPSGKLSSLPPGRTWRGRWYDPRTGKWTNAGKVTSDARGAAELPQKPSDEDWALRLDAAR